MVLFGVDKRSSADYTPLNPRLRLPSAKPRLTAQSNKSNKYADIVVLIFRLYRQD
jgi:hypothetical protein